MGKLAQKPFENLYLRCLTAQNAKVVRALKTTNRAFERPLALQNRSSGSRVTARQSFFFEKSSRIFDELQLPCLQRDFKTVNKMFLESLSLYKLDFVSRRIDHGI